MARSSCSSFFLFNISNSNLLNDQFPDLLPDYKEGPIIYFYITHSSRVSRYFFPRSIVANQAESWNLHLWKRYIDPIPDWKNRFISLLVPGDILNLLPNAKKNVTQEDRICVHPPNIQNGSLDCVLKGFQRGEILKEDSQGELFLCWQDTWKSTFCHVWNKISWRIEVCGQERFSRNANPTFRFWTVYFKPISSGLYIPLRFWIIDSNLKSLLTADAWWNIKTDTRPTGRR